MKKLLLTLVMAFSFIGSFAMTGTEEIILTVGEDPGGVILRNVRQPIRAFVTDDAVKVDFLVNATLTVEVKNAAGTSVYNQTVNAVEGTELLIDTTSFAEGSYAISITNANGYCWKGSFEVVN